jgi:cytochrome P450
VPTISKLQDPLSPPSREFLENPYPVFKRFREEAPVWWSAKGKYWIVTRHAEVNQVLSNLAYQKRLDRWKEINPLARMLPSVKQAIKSRSQWMLNMDPPDHTRMRSLVNKAFTPSTVAGLSSHIEQIASELLTAAEAKGEIDIIHDYAFPLPITVIAHMLGVPPQDRDLFRKFSHMLTSTLEVTPSIKGVAEGNKAIDGLIEYLRPLVAERRKNPKEDLISTLIAAEEQGNKLTEEELLQNCVLMLIAGHETTVNLIGNNVLDLLTHPDQWEMVKANSDLIPAAVQETLRYNSPIQMARRLAGEDLELGGQKIKNGDMISVMLGAANHDPAVYENPDVFDIRREQKRNLAFGQGIHHCVGSSLAEAEGKIALRMIAQRMPNLKLKTEKFDWRESVLFRGVNSLPATF